MAARPPGGRLVLGGRLVAGVGLRTAEEIETGFGGYVAPLVGLHLTRKRTFAGTNADCTLVVHGSVDRTEYSFRTHLFAVEPFFHYAGEARYGSGRTPRAHLDPRPIRASAAGGDGRQLGAGTARSRRRLRRQASYSHPQQTSAPSFFTPQVLRRPALT